MANDIVASISGNPVKNGSAIIYANKLGGIITNNVYVSTKPTIANIEAKYDARFDDPRYYSGDTAN